MSRFSVPLALVCGLVFVSATQAASLQVSPVSLDLTAPARTASLTLRNESDSPSNVQIRVFKWTQTNGADQLTPATDVVVSPPATQVQPGKAYTIRVAHTDAPVQKSEESYRLLIDELPEVNVHRRRTSVDLITRYSIPVFFSDRSASADVSWSVQRKGKNLVVEATNNGKRHAKLANLAVAAAGKPVSFGAGLNGYVLPGSTMRWTAAAGPVNAGSHVTITAKGDDYAVNQTAVVSAGR